MDEGFDAIDGGIAFGLAGVLTDEIREEIRRNPATVVPLGPTDIPFSDAAEQPYEEFVADWDSYVGQGPLKEQVKVAIQSARARYDAMPHTLLASGVPGVGKTTLARLIAKEYGTRIKMLVPPFTAKTLYDAAMSMDDWEFLFIDEIHKLADYGPRAAENLLHLLEERTLYLDSGVHKLREFTVLGATTDADKLPETILDRFMLKPYFQPYSLEEMVRITHNFGRHYDLAMFPRTIMGIAQASRRTPRVARELVLAARDLTITTGTPSTIEEVLAFKEIDPDGMTRVHKAYVTAMYQFYGRENAKGETEYVAGEASMMSMLRETRQGIGRIERFLIERGLLDRTPRGRRLTPLGIAKAQDYLR